MAEKSGYFSALRAVGWVVLAAMAIALIYALSRALVNWASIAV